MLALGCLEVERLRSRRRMTGNGGRIDALASTIVLTPAANGFRETVGLTHFMLKRLYTRYGLLFGKFWPGQKLVGENGHPVTEPPSPLLVIRSSLAKHDLRFFEHRSRPFRNAFLNASDDGNILEGPFLSMSVSEFAERLTDLETHSASDKEAACLRLAREAYRTDVLHELSQSKEKADDGPYASA